MRRPLKAARMRPALHRCQAGNLRSGVVWDYLRLKLDENAKPA